MSDSRLVVQFTILGEPVGQPRPRVFGGGRVRSDSKESKAWKAAAKEAFAARLGALGLPSPLFPEGPVALAVVAAFQLPAGEHRKRTVTPRRWHIARPDIDNVLKAPMDAATRQTLQRPKEAKTARGTAQRLSRYEQAVRVAARGLLWGDDSQVCWCLVTKVCCAQDEAPFLELQVGALRESCAAVLGVDLEPVIQGSRLAPEECRGCGQERSPELPCW